MMPRNDHVLTHLRSQGHRQGFALRLRSWSKAFDGLELIRLLLLLCDQLCSSEPLIHANYRDQRIMLWYGRVYILWRPLSSRH